jgi:hypothetical protein
VPGTFSNVEAVETHNRNVAQQELYGFKAQMTIEVNFLIVRKQT